MAHGHSTPVVLAMSVFLLFAAYSSDVPASGLSDFTGIDLDIPSMTLRFNRPQPEKLPQIIQNLPRDAANFFLNPAGPQLAFHIRQAHAQANSSSRPMPQSIKSQLAPFFPPRILDKAKSTTRGEAGISLATTTLEVNGDIAAITLNNIIVFRDNAATLDAALWAHELIHVSQYDNMGIDGFAAMYAGPGANTLENDAYAYGAHVQNQLNNSNSASLSSQWIDNRGSTPGPNITWSTFNQAARAVIPPHQCAQWSVIDPYNYTVTNICPVGLVIVGVNNNGFRVPCNGPRCFYPPNSQHALHADVPGNVIGIWFEFR